MPTPYIMIKKEVDVTEIRYIHSIWLRGKDGTFTVDEMKEIAAVTGCRYEGAFILPDGDKVEY